MKLIEQYIEPMDHISSIAMYRKIESAGRACYKSEDKITDNSYEAFIRMLISRNHACFDEETEVLTDKGFVLFSELSTEHLVANINKDTMLLDQFTKPSIHKYLYNGILYGISNRNYDFRITPNHRIFCSKSNSEHNRIHPKFEICIADDNNGFNEKKNIHTPIRMSTVLSGTTSTNKTHDSYFKLVGFFIGDGYTHGGNTLRFHLKKRRKIDYLYKICDECGLEIKEKRNNVYVVYGNDIGNIFNGLYYDENRIKTIPNSYVMLSNKEIKDILDGLLNSDGSFSDTGYVFSSTSKPVINMFQTLSSIVGQSVSIKDNGYLYVSHERNRRKHPHLNDARDIKSFVKDYVYSGYVYCCTVDSGLILTRRNNKIIISGNSVLEHGHVSLKWVTERGVSHELVRHRLMSYSMESTRYCNYAKDDIEFIKPVDFSINEDMLDMIENEYKYMIKFHGLTPQQARAILPNCLKTEIVISGNIRAWREMLVQRISPAAHPQMRDIAMKTLQYFKDVLPLLFEDIVV